MSVRYSKKKKSFLISTTVECDCDDCDQTIESEVEVEVDLEEILEQVDVNHLSKALSDRKLYMPDHFSRIYGLELKRMLCDMVETGYHISNEQLINKIKEKL